MKYLIGVVAAVLVAAGAAAALLTRGDDEDLSPDCLQAEEALRPSAGAMGEVLRVWPADVTDEPLDRASAAAKEARAAEEIRARGARIESATLRAEVYAVADAFDTISRSTLAPASETPSKEYFGAKTRINEAIYAVATACPGIGDDVPPPVRP